jgi:TonB family protein
MSVHPTLDRFLRILALLVIVTLHVAAFRVVDRSTAHSSPRLNERRLVTVFIQPKVVDGPIPRAPDLARITVATPVVLVPLHVDQPAIDFDVARNSGARVAAPTLRGAGGSDMTPYIEQAALLPGEGATVVLRIEILETGDPGRVEIEASSGSRQVDQAAINYARTRHWYAGRINGLPQVMWIRWGVRLQA